MDIRCTCRNRVVDPPLTRPTGPVDTPHGGELEYGAWSGAARPHFMWPPPYRRTARSTAASYQCTPCEARPGSHASRFLPRDTRPGRATSPRSRPRPGRRPPPRSRIRRSRVRPVPPDAPPLCHSLAQAPGSPCPPAEPLPARMTRRSSRPRRTRQRGSCGRSSRPVRRRGGRDRPSGDATRDRGHDRSATHPQNWPRYPAASR